MAERGANIPHVSHDTGEDSLVEVENTDAQAIQQGFSDTADSSQRATPKQKAYKDERLQHDVLDVEVGKQKRTNMPKTEEEFRASLAGELSTGKFHDQYVKQDEIGYGHSGKVFRGTSVTDQTDVAIKVIPIRRPDGRLRKHVVNEVRILKSCSDANIVIYLDSYLTNTELYLVTEFLKGKSLNTPGACYSNNEKIFRQILQAMDFLHKKKIMHRDIKGDHIIVDTQEHVKLIDFGLCVHEECDFELGRVGTKHWMAPELVQHQRYDCKVDIWSFGITVIEVLDGHPPHVEVKDKYTLYKLIVDSDPPTLRKYHSDSYLQDFLENCLRKDPKNRASAESLLTHPYLTYKAQ